MDLYKESFSIIIYSVFFRCFSTQPDNQGNLPHSALKSNIHFQVKTYTSFLISRDEYELILLLINLRFICDLISFLLHFDSEIVLRQTCFQNKLQIISQMHLHLLQILFSLMALSPLQANMSYNLR